MRGVATIDIVDGVPQGKSLDLLQATPLWHSAARLTGSTNLDDVAGSAVVGTVVALLVTAPARRRRPIVATEAD